MATGSRSWPRYAAPSTRWGTTGLIIGAGCTVPGDIPIPNVVIARQAVVE
jgi:hypothetical protein